MGDLLAVSRGRLWGVLMLTKTDPQPPQCRAARGGRAGPAGKRDRTGDRDKRAPASAPQRTAAAHEQNSKFDGKKRSSAKAGLDPISIFSPSAHPSIPTSSSPPHVSASAQPRGPGDDGLAARRRGQPAGRQSEGARRDFRRAGDRAATGAAIRSLWQPAIVPGQPGHGHRQHRRRASVLSGGVSRLPASERSARTGKGARPDGEPVHQRKGRTILYKMFEADGS